MKLKKREIVFIIFLTIIIAVAGIVILITLREYSKGEIAYIELQDYIVLPKETPVVEPESGESAGAPGAPTLKPEPGETADMSGTLSEEGTGNAASDTGFPIVDFDGLQALNPDILGWIYSAGTPVNYPIVQGNTNEEYLYRLVDGNSNKCGSIFLDCMNDRDFQDANSVIHGHNMNNGSMFAELRKYAEQEYYDEHTEIWLITPEQTYSIEVFAAFVTAADSDVWKLAFSSEEEFTAWKSEMIEKSFFKSKISPTAGEKVVTLSTCSYEFDNAHFVVMGVLR